MRHSQLFLEMLNLFGCELKFAAVGTSKNVVLSQDVSDGTVINTILWDHFMHRFSMYQMIIYDGNTLFCINPRTICTSASLETKYSLIISGQYLLLSLLFLFFLYSANLVDRFYLL